jgi:hypothetical protein
MSKELRYKVSSLYAPARFQIDNEYFMLFRDPHCQITCDMTTLADPIVLKWWQEYGKGPTDGEAYRALVRLVAEALKP